MFTQIALTNFKAYRRSKRIQLKPLTFIVGANNSGKSSLLHAILLLAQTLDDSTSRQALITSGSYVDLGGYFDIIWGAQQGKARTFSISLNFDRRGWDRRFAYRRSDGDENQAPYKLDLSFAFDSGRNAIVVSRAQISGDQEVFSSARRSGSRGYSIPHLSKTDAKNMEVGWRHFMPALHPAPDYEFSSRGRDKLIDKFMAADEGWGAWATEFGRVAHVAPLRQPVPRFGILGKSLNSELGPGGENLLRVLRASDDGSETGARLATDVSRWVADNFKMLRRLELVDVDQSGTILALLGDERGGFDGINLANMGEGLSQLLPIIARVLTTPRFGSLLIEQPELHLHPAAQADLADLFISGAEKEDRQFIVETHSEHLLLRLRRRIAEGVIAPEAVAVLYVERDGSESAVRSLDLDAAGHFDDWPKGFFDERYREALAIAEASQKQKEKGDAESNGLT